MIRVYCSEDCLRGIDEIGVDIDVDQVDVVASIEEPPRRARWWIAAGFLVGGTFVMLYAVGRDEPSPGVPSPLLSPVAPPAAVPAPVVTVAISPEPAPPQDSELLHELA